MRLSQFWQNYSHHRSLFFSVLIHVVLTLLDRQSNTSNSSGPKILLFAASSRYVLFELLLHGGNAAELVEWWQQFSTNAFVRRVAGGGRDARNGTRYGEIVNASILLF
jgi:hypothetical protein